ncbi:Tryptophan synthase alpha chain [Labilithrix luteola]|uniref:Tryptophan synthase alpha chain n=1 Tax=Labilithrix luteola TaxID=1391654 RepID=A0A0K1Q449_9BACT|nr:hypothetical protein [Labilithrix luteola]AKV00160.1 Tryptophan synthase alpha chain [Labilithrix luteola]
MNEQRRSHAFSPRLRRLSAGAATALAALAASCTASENRPISLGNDEPTAPSFTPTEAAEAGAEASLPHALMCPATECPAPYATCKSSPAVCGTNLNTDVQNCGACGNTCGDFRKGLNMASRCVDGACVFECAVVEHEPLQVFRDCNSLLDDGCEIDVWSDAKNCGACGNKCAEGDPCIDGVCGCRPGQIACSGYCVDPRNSDSNCNTCRNVCEYPADACATMPPHTLYGCADRECGRLKCNGAYSDCNGDLSQGCASDGCETSLDTPANCGGCGIACAPNEECVLHQFQNSGYFQCEPSCASAGLTQCTGKCTDLLTDTDNCGVCGNKCMTDNGPPLHQVPACRKGMCMRECSPGFADCNGDPIDGCEVELKNNPANCGACGNQCDMSAGQPCIEGKCLTVECDAGVVTK